MNADITQAIELVRKFDALKKEIDDFLDRVGPDASSYHPAGTVELRLWIADATASQTPAAS